ncbi:MAG: hypothetical protein U0Z44_15445 [Kouleothrix sp.]
MLRLGEAYRGLALNTGGWYVPAFAQQPALRALGQAWYWPLALLFVLVAALLRRLRGRCRVRNCCPPTRTGL